jgi:hypothetical protein
MYTVYKPGAIEDTHLGAFRTVSEIEVMRLNAQGDEGTQFG